MHFLRGCEQYKKTVAIETLAECRRVSARAARRIGGNSGAGAYLWIALRTVIVTPFFLRRTADERRDTRSEWPSRLFLRLSLSRLHGQNLGNSGAAIPFGHRVPYVGALCREPKTYGDQSKRKTSKRAQGRDEDRLTTPV